jgi:hypothetical protein
MPGNLYEEPVRDLYARKRDTDWYAAPEGAWATTILHHRIGVLLR